MEPRQTASLTYRRETYRLWFEYLKVVRTSRNPKVIAALKSTTDFYAPWEVTLETRFDPWWKTHQHLFAEEHTVRVLAHGEVPSDPDALVVMVPLTQSPTVLTKQVKAIIQAAVVEREKSTATKKKAKKSPSARYRPTDGAEPKLAAVREMLTVYRDVHLKNPKLRGEALLNAAHALYLGRKNKKWAKIPMALQHVGMDDKIRAMRNLRRWMQKAEAVVLNVARGEFPGEY